MPADLTLRRWYLAIVTIFFAGGLALASYLARMPHVRDILGASTSQMSLLVFALAVGSMLGLLLASHIDAMIGPRRSMLIFAVLGQAGLVTAAAGTATASFTLVAAGLAVLGLGTGVVDVVMNVSGAALEQQRARTTLPIFHAMFSFGTLAGAGAGALTERLDVPMGIHLTCVAALNVILIGTTNRWVQQPPPQGNSPRSARERMRAWREAPTLLIGLVVLGMALAEGSANDWLALAMVDGHGVSNETGAAALGVFLAAMTAVRLLGVRLVDTYGRVQVLRVCAATAFAGLALVIFVDDVAWAFVGTALWGAGAALGFPLGMSAAADDPQHAAARVSVVSTIGYLAFLVAPPVIGLVGEHSSLRQALLIVLVTVAIAGLLSSTLQQPRRARRSELPVGHD